MRQTNKLSRQIILTWFLLICAGVLLAAVSAVVFAAKDNKQVTRQLGNDVFLAGGDIRLTRDVEGDAVMAGGQIVLDATVGGDAVVAGGEITVRGDIAQDLYAAGGEVRLDGSVGDSARIAGGEIHVSRDARVRGGMSLAGGEVEVDGEIGSYLQIAAGEVRINGRVVGDVEVSGGELVLGPQAVVEGSVVFRGPRPAQVMPGAQVGGEVRHIQHERRGLLRGVFKAFGVFALVWLIGWFVVGAVLIGLLPRMTHTVAEVARRRVGVSLLVGLAVLIGAPIVITVLMVTVLGIPLGLVLLGLYLLILPLGYLFGSMTIGDGLLARMRHGRQLLRRHRIPMLLGVLIVLAILALIPVLGALLCILVMLAGIGAVVLAAFRRPAVVAETSAPVP